MLMLGNPQFTHSCILQRKIEVLLQSSNFYIAAHEEQICMEPIKSKHRIINYFGHRGKTELTGTQHSCCDPKGKRRQLLVMTPIPLHFNQQFTAFYEILVI